MASICFPGEGGVGVHGVVPSDRWLQGDARLTRECVSIFSRLPGPLPWQSSLAAPSGIHNSSRHPRDKPCVRALRGCLTVAVGYLC